MLWPRSGTTICLLRLGAMCLIYLQDVNPEVVWPAAQGLSAHASAHRRARTATARKRKEPSPGRAKQAVRDRERFPTLQSPYESHRSREPVGRRGRIADNRHAGITFTALTASGPSPEKRRRRTEGCHRERAGPTTTTLRGAGGENWIARKCMAELGISCEVTTGSGRPMASTKGESGFGGSQFGSPTATLFRTRGWRIRTGLHSPRC